MAFACLRTTALGLSTSTACITATDGWRFIDSNAALHVVIACSAEVAATRTARDGISLIVPLRRGDRIEGPLGAMSRVVPTDSAIVSLTRPSSSTFEQQLVRLGEESDAARLTRSVGRSWSVYRRVRARNPAIRHPAWLESSRIRTLSTLSLVGSWNSAKSGDRTCVEAIDGRPYEVLEQDLRSLSRVDDSPVTQIGTVWRARSPLELLHLCAPEFTTSGVLDRFFSVTEAVLAKPDPSLELDEDKRWMASVYGKTREESGIVIDAIADSLIKLSVYAERESSISADALLSRVNALVRRLLHDANGERWLSISGVLRELAEAAPDEFLSAIDKSLRSSPNAVIHDNGVRTTPRALAAAGTQICFGLWSCWHGHRALVPSGCGAGQVDYGACSWELGQYACKITAIVVPCVVASNDGNKRKTSRGAGQTHSGSQRISLVLDGLDASSRISNGEPKCRSVWREDDAGKADLRGRMDLWYLSEVGARLIAQAVDRPERIATLVASLDSFDGTYKDSVVHLVETSTKFDDDGRAVVRNSLREYLSWHNSFNIDDRTGHEQLQIVSGPCSTN